MLPSLSQLHINALCRRSRAPYFLLDYHRTIASTLAKETQQTQQTDETRQSKKEWTPSADSSSFTEAASDDRMRLFERLQHAIGTPLQRLEATQFKRDSVVLPKTPLLKVLQSDLLNRRWVVVFDDGSEGAPIMRWLIFVLDSKNDLHAFVYNYDDADEASTGLGTWDTHGRDQFTEFLKDPQALLYYDTSDPLELLANEVFGTSRKRRTLGGRVSDESAKPNPLIEWKQAMVDVNVKDAADGQPDQDDLDDKGREEWSLRKEYEAHLAWLRMLQAPLEVDTSIEVEDESVPLATPSSNNLEFVKNDLEQAMRELQLFKQPAWREWFQHARIMLDAQRLALDCANAFELANEQLVQPSFPALGAVQDDRATTRSSATKGTILLWKDMIGAVYDSQYYTKDRLLPLYSVRMPKGPIDQPDSGSLPSQTPLPLQVEHIVPQSWLHASGSLCGFEYATDDPLLCFVTTKAHNEARGTRPLQFGRGLNVPGTYAVPLRSQQAFLARVNAYAALTYPLVGPYSEATMGRSTRVDANANSFTSLMLQTQARPYKQLPNDPCYTRVVPSISSMPLPHDPLLLGIAQYAQQWDALMTLLAQDPDPWERILSHMCYVEHRRRNPLMHSARVREALTTPSHPWNALLRRRWQGVDLTSRAMLS